MMSYEFRWKNGKSMYLPYSGIESFNMRCKVSRIGVGETKVIGGVSVTRLS